MLHERDSGTETKTMLAKTQRSRVSRQGWKLAITQPGAHTSLNWPPTLTARREMLKSCCIFSSFFLEKDLLCSGCTHKQAVCERESVIRGVFVKEIFRYLC